MKTREFDCFDAYCNYYENHEHKLNDVDIVENRFRWCADGEFECKSWKTAVKRFFKALAGDDRFDGWEDGIIESIENGYWKDVESYWDDEKGKCVHPANGYHWSVEETLEGQWYIELTVGK